MTGASASRALPAVSSTAVAAFSWYARRLVAKRFSAVRVMSDGAPPAGSHPTILYANHASWWDPMVLMLVARTYFPGRRVYAPIDAQALQRYPVLRRLGLFAVRPDSFAGTRDFLAIGREVLSAEGGGLLALTPQSRFADVRERPALLRGGLALLMEAVPDARAWPVALEYTFWNEMRPEILIRFGQQPVMAGGEGRRILTDRLAASLEAEQDRLADAACSRDANRFRILVDGASGIGFWQDLPARLRAMVRGRRFDPAHAAVSAGREQGNRPRPDANGHERRTGGA